LGLSLFVLTSTTAQITITSNDVAGYYTIGNVISERFDTLPGTLMIDIGAPGGGNTWDYSGISSISDVIETQMVVDPATTPNAADFPGATAALFFEIEEEGVTGSLYTYLALQNDLLLFLGNSGSSTFEEATLTSKITYDPNEQALKFPVNFGDSWSYEGKQTLQSSIDGEPLPPQEDDLENTSVVDAYGTLIYPDGSSAPALRIKEVSVTSGEVIPGFPVVDTSTNYTFITKTGNILTVSYTGDGTGPDQGMIEGSISWSISGMASSVVDLEAEGFRLEAPQVHPVRESSLVKYTLPESENIRISLFDIQGREVKVLANGLQAAGEHTIQLDATDLSSGAYFMSLMARKAVITQKVIVQK
jgi:hypothetical protein